MLTYKLNRKGDLKAAYSGAVRVGYLQHSSPQRWIWALNTIQPEGGRATGIEPDEYIAKQRLEDAWVKWVTDANLRFEPP